jgi:ATP-independent RNA helicase DbpA
MNTITATSMKEIPAFAGIKKLVTLDFLSHAKPVRSELQIKYLRADDQDKLQLLFRLICALNNKLTLVFCNHREAVDRIGELLAEKGLSHGVFHGGMEQEDRERTLIKFRNGSHRLLITTDLASFWPYRLLTF